MPAREYKLGRRHSDIYYSLEYFDTYPVDAVDVATVVIAKVGCSA